MRDGWLNVHAGEREAEIIVDGFIGDSWDDASNTYSRAFRAALDSVAPGVKITVGLNSPGGAIDDGLAIFNAIRQRGGVTVRVDGYALSIASLILQAGERRLVPKSAMVMEHNPWSGTIGDADDMRKAAEMLDKHGQMIADVVASRTGRNKEDVLASMKAETWYTGSEAVQAGMADEEIDSPVTFARFDASKFFRVPKALAPFALKTFASAQEEHKQTDTRMKLLLAALAGAKLIPASENITDEAASAAVVAALASRDSEAQSLRAEIAEAKKAAEKAEAELTKARKSLAEAAVDADVKAGRLKDDEALRAKWVESYEKDFDGTKTLMAGLAEQKPATQRGVSPETLAENRTAENAEEILKAYSSATDPVKRAKLWAEHRETIIKASRAK